MREKEEGLIRLEEKQSFDGTSVGVYVYDMFIKVTTMQTDRS